MIKFTRPSMTLYSNTVRNLIIIITFCRTFFELFFELFFQASEDEDEGDEPRSKIVSSSISRSSDGVRVPFLTKLIESDTWIGIRVGGGIGGSGGGVVLRGEVIVFGGMGGGNAPPRLFGRLFEFWQEKFVRLEGDEATLWNNEN